MTDEELAALSMKDTETMWRQSLEIDRLRADNERMRKALKLVATGIWRDKKRNACGVSGGAAVVHEIEAAIDAAKEQK